MGKASSELLERERQAGSVQRETDKDHAFYHEFIVTLKDVNMYGTVYFSRYFEWQGIARELYFATAENFQQIMSGMLLITKYAWNDYIKHIHVFDHLVVKVQNRNIKRCSYEVIFTFFNKRTNEIVARAGQTICFADIKTGKIVKLPDQIVQGASKNLYKE